MDELPIPRCQRLVRPLLAKIHALTDLYHKYPSKFALERHPPPRDAATAAGRLAQLKPLLAPELHRAYCDIFAICRSIFSTLGLPRPAEPPGPPGPPGLPRPPPVARLSALAATKLGKLVALGTKSTYYRLNHALLFDPHSLPPHLRLLHASLAPDIALWLDMDPAPVTRRFRRAIVAGYVVHVLVSALRPALYLLVPVVAHWLHEHHSPLLRTLFAELWAFLALDPDCRRQRALFPPDPTAPQFWALHHSGYWACLARRLGAHDYDSLLLHCLTQPGRLDALPPAHVYALAARCPQHPNTCAVLMAVLALAIGRAKRRSRLAARTLDSLHAAYCDARAFAHAWLGLHRRAIFHSQHLANAQLFRSLALLLRYVASHAAAAADVLAAAADLGRDDLLRRFSFLSYHAHSMHAVLRLLRAYYLDRTPPLLAGSSPALVADFFADFVRPSPETAHFLLWLHSCADCDLDAFARAAFSLLYPDTLPLRFFATGSVAGRARRRAKRPLDDAPYVDSDDDSCVGPKRPKHTA